MLQTPVVSGPGDGGDGVVMVAGATGGVGKRVVERLLLRGAKARGDGSEWVGGPRSRPVPPAQVRALVRDVDKARKLLGTLPRAAGATLEIAAADITQPRTLLPEFFQGVSAVVCCTAVKVQPKEGDTADRSVRAIRPAWAVTKPASTTTNTPTGKSTTRASSSSTPRWLGTRPSRSSTWGSGRDRPAPGSAS